MSRRKGVLPIAGLVIVLALLLIVFGKNIFPGDMGDTAGATGYTCKSTVTPSYIDLSCSGSIGADCEWSGGWSFNGISDNTGHVAVSQAVCADYRQTWDGQCKFDNLNALAPYATGSVTATPGTGSVPVCTYSFPLGFYCKQSICRGGTHGVTLNARWNVPPPAVVVQPPAYTSPPSIPISPQPIISPTLPPAQPDTSFFGKIKAWLSALFAWIGG